jgi:hypothetical protein
VHDLGSKIGATLDGAPLGSGDVPWKPGQVLAFGGSCLEFDYPAAEALAELERSPDEPIRPGETFELAEPERDEATPPPEPAPLEEAPLASERRRPAARKPPEGGWGFTDAAIVILALGVLSLSIAGLWLLLAK